MTEEVKCKCNYHLGMGPNLLCPKHGKREDLGNKIERQSVQIIRMESMKDDFNAAIDFALDEAEGEGILFLNLWREGDWESIQNEFPKFKLSEALLNAKLWG